MLKRLAYTVGSLFLALALFCVWWCLAANYDYDALSGTYAYRDSNINSVLILKPDRTFTQRLTQGGQQRTAVGTWSRFGEGSVAFSGSFLRLPRQQSYTDKFGPGADALTAPDFGGHFEKVFTLYPELQLDAKPENLVFHRKLFSNP
jgi:hypothetical protein